MPTKVKRCQVLLKEKVLEEVEKISEETGVSLSKVISALTEEALLNRGVLGADNSGASKTSFSEFYKEQIDKSNKQLVEAINETPELTDGDIELLGKLKKLKALEEAGII